MNNEKKFNFKEVTKNAMSFSKEKYDDAVKYTRDVAAPKLKETAVTTRDTISNSVTKISDKVKTKITEEQMQEILNTLYIKSINGIPKVSLQIDDLVNDYITHNSSVEKAAKSLINSSTVKCGTSGFLTGLGGLTSMVATLPANITSVMYVQLRMCCAIAKMGGYDIHSDQVQTLIYACLTGSAISDILKQVGIKFGNKFGVAMVKKIPGATLTAINQKVGFRFITKFGETGVVNLGKVVPVLGGVIGGGVDVASTRVIGNNAFKIFIKGEMPDDSEEKEDIIEAKYDEIEDVDTKLINGIVN